MVFDNLFTSKFQSSNKHFKEVCHKFEIILITHYLQKNITHAMHSKGSNGKLISQGQGQRIWQRCLQD